MVDHQDVDRAFLRREFEPKLLLHGLEQGLL
jgi:hypothetical protein